MLTLVTHIVVSLYYYYFTFLFWEVEVVHHFVVPGLLPVVKLMVILAKHYKTTFKQETSSENQLPLRLARHNSERLARACSALYKPR